MKYLINLLLETICVLILLNILVMLIPKNIRRGISGTFHLLSIICQFLFDLTLSAISLVKTQVFSCLRVKTKKPTRRKTSKKQSNKVINLKDKAQS